LKKNNTSANILDYLILVTHVMKIEFRPRSRVKPESTYLLQYARIVTSQYGEDGILEKIFEIIQPANQYCVEIGAFD
jgi:hypothetical protein